MILPLAVSKYWEFPKQPPGPQYGKWDFMEENLFPISDKYKRMGDS